MVKERDGAVEDCEPDLVTWDRIVVDRKNRRAYRNGSDLNLSRQELAILVILIRAQGRVVGVDELMIGAPRGSSGSATTMRGIVHHLRRKLGAPSPIVTEMSSGYRWAYSTEGRDPATPLT